ncbi:MAG: hypothetical protein DSY91_01560 [Deltaproteobacteria bacterium]|nr:MAG: hypothetical protein DSY91_01560 [Deltaproteobacteria bacterium]
MDRFEYEITRHSLESFKDLVYFCSELGTCSIETVQGDQVKHLEELLNKRGKEGWQLVNLAFGKDGFVAFWMRKIS